MFVKATGDARMYDYDWAPATIDPKAVIFGMKQLGRGRVSAWTGERTPPVPELASSRDMEKPVLAVVALAALVAALLWGRSARRLQRVWQRIEDELGPDADATRPGPLRRTARSSTPSPSTR